MIIKKTKNMSSKRILKKNLNAMVYDIVEECYTAQLLDEKKTAKADKIIDEAADFQDLFLAKINSAKSKADFKGFKAEIEAKAIDFVEKLNKLN